MSTSSAVLERARQWLDLDFNETTAAYVRNLVEDTGPDAAKKLSELFPDKRIEFGTAGLRAAMSPGPVGMNDLVVVQVRDTTFLFLTRGGW